MTRLTAIIQSLNCFIYNKTVIQLKNSDDNNFIMNFFDTIKSLAKKQGLTIADVCKKAGLSQSAYDSLKRRNNLPRLDTAKKMAEALGVSCDYLAGGSVLKPNETRSSVLAKLGQLSHDDLLLAEGYIDGLLAKANASKKERHA